MFNIFETSTKYKYKEPIRLFLAPSELFIFKCLSVGLSVGRSVDTFDFLGMLGYIGVYWGILESIGVYCAILSYIGVYWSILEYIGAYWGILRYIKVYDI